MIKHYTEQKTAAELLNELNQLRKALVDQIDGSAKDAAEGSKIILNNINEYRKNKKLEEQREFERNKIRLQYYNHRHQEQQEFHGESCSRTIDHLTYLKSIHND